MCDIEPLSWLLRHVPTTGIIFFWLSKVSSVLKNKARSCDLVRILVSTEKVIFK